MTWKRQQRIRELEAELAELRRQETVEAEMISNGWVPLENGAYRIPGSIEHYRGRR